VAGNDDVPKEDETMATWVQQMAIGREEGCGGCGSCGPDQPWPDRTGSMREGAVCGCNPAGGEGCSETLLPPGNGDEGVDDLYLCC